MTTPHGVPAPDGGPGAFRCPRHPDRPAFVRCQRCNRPACPACQVPAAVGIQCVDCVRQDQAAHPRLRSILGVTASGGPPLCTIVLIGLCVVVSAVGWLAPALAVTEHLGFVPVLARAEPWRVVTSIFDHAGLAHLALNMLCLWMVGSFLEPMLGRWRFTALYLVSGLGGGLLILGWARVAGPSVEWVQLTVGASGAIFGMFGAMVWVVRRLGGNLRGILVVLAINVVFTLTNSGSVSWQGHFGGLIVGLGLGAVYAFAPRGRHRVYSIVATAGIAALVLGAYAALSTGLPTSDAIMGQLWG